jgi:hypothetical protein
MSNTTVVSGKFISIELDGATDWNVTTDLWGMVRTPGESLLVKSITISGRAAADKVIIRNSALSAQTAAKIVEFLCTAEVLHFRLEFGDNGSWMTPAFDAADLTGDTNVVIELV